MPVSVQCWVFALLGLGDCRAAAVSWADVWRADRREQTALPALLRSQEAPIAGQSGRRAAQPLVGRRALARGRGRGDGGSDSDRHTPVLTSQSCKLCMQASVYYSMVAKRNN